MVREIWSFSASIRTLLKIGIVALEPTTLSTWDKAIGEMVAVDFEFHEDGAEAGYSQINKV